MQQTTFIPIHSYDVMQSVNILNRVCCLVVVVQYFF